MCSQAWSWKWSRMVTGTSCSRGACFRTPSSAISAAILGCTQRFGAGLDFERLAMIRYKIGDIRKIVEARVA